MIHIILLSLIAISLSQTCIGQCNTSEFCIQNQCYSCNSITFNQQIPKWGQITGSINGVNGYSNKGDWLHLFQNKQDFLLIQDQEIYVGQKYQCVHFARKYWLVNYNTTFDSINTANQIFDLKNAYDYFNQKYRQLVSIPNGSSNWPRVGDLLIWQKQFNSYPAGHVAVIVDIDYTSKYPNVKIAEQNYDDIWDDQHYSRSLLVQIDQNNNLTIINKRIEQIGKEELVCRDYQGSEKAVILGWVRLDE